MSSVASIPAKEAQPVSAFQAYDPAKHVDDYGWLWTDTYGLYGWHLVRTIEDRGELRVYVAANDRTYDADVFVARPYVAIRPPMIDGNEYPPGVMATIVAPGGRIETFVWAADHMAPGIYERIRGALTRITGNAGPATEISSNREAI